MHKSKTRLLSAEDAAELEARTGLREEPGWTGFFTRRDVPGAMPAGTQIVKVASEPGDTNPVGTRGLVLGSIANERVADGAVFYFIEWETSPRLAVGCIAWKIGKPH